MAKGQAGRPRSEGDRYPSGDLKPAKTPAATDLTRTPISGALWQRMLSDAEKVFGDARFGTELGRLGATGQLTPSEVATGFRVAGIYGRFEYYHGKSRSAASPHYIREFIAEGAGQDTELINFRFKEGRERDRSFAVDDAEVRERDAAKAFRQLQDVIPLEHRPHVERLCVENVHVGYQGLIRARIGLAIAKQYFIEKDTGRAAKTKKEQRKRTRAALSALSIPEHAPKKGASINSFKASFFKVQRSLNPGIREDVLERAWETLCSVKALDDFRREKLERANAPAS